MRAVVLMLKRILGLEEKNFLTFLRKICSNDQKVGTDFRNTVYSISHPW